MRTILVRLLTILLLPFPVFGMLPHREQLPTRLRAPQTFRLDYETFKASGAGDTIPKGTIRAEEFELQVDNATTWQAGHGIRVQRAGTETQVDNADSGWSALHPYVHVTHIDDGARAFVRCKLTTQEYIPPDTSIDLCGVAFPVKNFDVAELSLWISPTMALQAGALQLVISDTISMTSTTTLQFPPLRAGRWNKVFLPIHGEKLVTMRRMILQCLHDCGALKVDIDDFRLMDDLITTVQAVEGTTLKLAASAGVSVTMELVYHDDTDAIQRWLNTASPSVHLVAPAGIYFMSRARNLVSNTWLTCENPEQVIFKSTGRSKDTGKLFVSENIATPQAAVPEHMVIEQCGFDANGWNRSDFLSLISISGEQTPCRLNQCQAARDIHIQDNKFFDSMPPPQTDCDLNQDACATRQRHYILVTFVDGVWIENNHLSHGGRIKVGRPGRNMHILNNHLDFVNDNAITIVDTIGSMNEQPCQHIDCVTEHVVIMGNIITDTVSTGIFFGADGERNLHEQMILRDIKIAQNTITGFFDTGIKGVLPATTDTISITNNVIHAERLRPWPENKQDTYGISLSGTNFDTGTCTTESESMSPATNITVAQNMVVTSNQAAVHSGGIAFSRSTRGLDVVDNTVTISDGTIIERGIRFQEGTYWQVNLHANTVTKATDALHLETTLCSGIISNNQFTYSTNPKRGQISIDLVPAETVDVRIFGNRITGGQGFGIWCRGVEKSHIQVEWNLILANARGSTNGPPECNEVNRAPTQYLPTIVHHEPASGSVIQFSR
jgi:hypothetical protein